MGECIFGRGLLFRLVFLLFAATGAFVGGLGSLGVGSEGVVVCGSVWVSIGWGLATGVVGYIHGGIGQLGTGVYGRLTCSVE